MRPLGDKAVERALSHPPDLVSRPGPPAHVRIERWLGELVDRGRLSPGDRLPPEQELSARLGVSRMTLRQALARLADTGILQRRPGRSGGTFVAQPRAEVRTSLPVGLVTQVRAELGAAPARVLEAVTRPAARAEAETLRLEPGEPVHQVVRVTSLRGQPVSLEATVLPADRCPDLLTRRLSGCVGRLLAKHYGLEPHLVSEVISPVTACPMVSETLGVELGTPVLQLDAVFSGADGAPYACVRDVVRADRTTLTVESRPGGI